jgi:non-ribosomal peptide synthetase-like protein
VLLAAVGTGWSSPHAVLLTVLAWAPAVALAFIVSHAVLTALLVRVLGSLLRPGWHGSGGLTGWAAWTRAELLADSRTALFPLYSTIYTRTWLRLAGLAVGRRTEISTAVGLSPLVRFGSYGFVADDVVFAAGRSRDGWLQLAPITVGGGAFLGNGALISGGTSLGQGSLVGAQATPPLRTPPGTSWFGVPALEFPRPAGRVDPRRTTAPPARLVAARAVMDLIRIVFPAAVSVILGVGVLLTLEMIWHAAGLLAVIAAVTPVLVAAGVAAVLVTAVVKWSLMGRYRAGEHPLWSFFVWRDEILNSCQESLAGA